MSVPSRDLGVGLCDGLHHGLLDENSGARRRVGLHHGLLGLLLLACGPAPEPVQGQTAHESLEPKPSTSEAEYVEEPAKPVLAAVAPSAPRIPVAASTPGSERPLFVNPGVGRKQTSCRAVAHIGDSTSTGMMKAYLVRDPEDRLDAQLSRVGVEEAYLELFGGRSMVEHRSGHENGVMVAERLRAGGFSGCWIVALGTNDTANVAKDSTVDRVARIERMMAVIGDEPVLWVDTITRTQTGYWAAANMQIWNDELAATLPRYPNARIYQWSLDMREEWFAKDGIHYNGDGYTARAMLTANALAAAFPPAKD